VCASHLGNVEGDTLDTAEWLLASLTLPRERHRTSRVEPLPLAAALSSASIQSTIRYAVGSIDDSGKVPAAQVLESLGWQGGDRLTVAVRRGVVVLQRDVDGLVAVTKRRALVIPAAARRACGIRKADAVLIAAIVGFNTAVVHPQTVIDRMMTLYHDGHDDV
jgi:bifunctional DNA-binding transcriptional regulator/antitoxin component of YhaV-PrlF toxin-antitoxin module